MVVRYVIPLSNTQRIAPQGFIVAPVTDLAIGEASQNATYEHGGNGGPRPADPKPGGCGAQAGSVEGPNDRDKQTDEGDVRVPVGHRLLTNRDNADHRN